MHMWQNLKDSQLLLGIIRSIRVRVQSKSVLEQAGRQAAQIWAKQLGGGALDEA